MYPFDAGSFAAYDGWYVAAFAADVTHALTSRTILNQPVVLFRRENGKAVALGGRCPHRHFPLGKSCLKGDSIVCGYHGITFSHDGRCVDIPSQNHIPPAYRIPAYPLVEHGMWLWIWPGDPDKADPALLPDLGEIGFSEAGMVACPFYTHEVRCRYQLLNDNLLDLTHLASLHGSTIGTIENASAPEQVSRLPGRLTSRRHMRDAAAPSMSFGETVRQDREVGMDFYLPGFHSGFTRVTVSAGQERAGELLHYGRVYHAVTPATPTTSHYFFGVAHPDGKRLEESRRALVPVIAEDIFASEQVESMLQLVGHPSELMLKSDRGAVEARRMLQAMMDSERPRMAQVLERRLRT